MPGLTRGVRLLLVVPLGLTIGGTGGCFGVPLICSSLEELSEDDDELLLEDDDDDELLLLLEDDEEELLASSSSPLLLVRLASSART